MMATPPMARARTCLKVGTPPPNEPTEPPQADWHLRARTTTLRSFWGGTLSQNAGSPKDFDRAFTEPLRAVMPHAGEVLQTHYAPVG
jgi:hypothetical protein